jgi:hypothetical protein
LASKNGFLQPVSQLWKAMRHHNLPVATSVQLLWKNASNHLNVADPGIELTWIFVRYTAVSATLTGVNKRTSSSRLGSMQLGLDLVNSFPGWSISKLDTPSPLGRNSEAFRNVYGERMLFLSKSR